MNRVARMLPPSDVEAPAMGVGLKRTRDDRAAPPTPGSHRLQRIAALAVLTGTLAHVAVQKLRYSRV